MVVASKFMVIKLVFNFYILVLASSLCCKLQNCELSFLVGTDRLLTHSQKSHPPAVGKFETSDLRTQTSLGYFMTLLQFWRAIVAAVTPHHNSILIQTIQRLDRRAQSVLTFTCTSTSIL